MPDNLSLLLEHGGITAVFALGLLYMLRVVGLQLVAAIGKLGEDVKANTAANAEMAERVSRLEGVLAGRESVTPIEGVPVIAQRQPSRPVGGGGYGPLRPKTEGSGR